MNRMTGDLDGPNGSVNKVMKESSKNRVVGKSFNSKVMEIVTLYHCVRWYG
jgi:hypothetical protein